MKRVSIVLSLLAILALTSAAFAVQGRGQGGAPVGGRAAMSPGSQGKRPAEAGSPKSTPATTHTTAGSHQSAGQKDPMGFRNYGQYVAATHVAENLKIDLNLLKTEMVDNKLSLGEAIKRLRPELTTQTVETEVKKAEAAGKKAQAETPKGTQPTS